MDANNLWCTGTKGVCSNWPCHHHPFRVATSRVRLFHDFGFCVEDKVGRIFSWISIASSLAEFCHFLFGLGATCFFERFLSWSLDIFFSSGQSCTFSHFFPCNSFPRLTNNLNGLISHSCVFCFAETVPVTVILGFFYLKVSCLPLSLPVYRLVH